LDRIAGIAYGLPQQPERHRVVMVIDLDMIIGRDRAALPLGKLVAFAWKPFQRSYACLGLGRLNGGASVDYGRAHGTRSRPVSPHPHRHQPGGGPPKAKTTGRTGLRSQPGATGHFGLPLRAQSRDGHSGVAAVRRLHHASCPCWRLPNGAMRRTAPTNA
jgi:hypothetical protein